MKKVITEQLLDLLKLFVNSSKIKRKENIRFINKRCNLNNFRRSTHNWSRD